MPQRAPGGLAGVLTGSRSALVAGLPLIAGSAGTATVLVFFASWPSHSGALQFVVGLAAGLVVWALLSVLAFRGFANPRTADAASFADLRVRFTTLSARREAVAEDLPGPPASRRVADAHIEELRSVLGEPDAHVNPTLWLSAWGYISLWRRLHRAEEELIQFAPSEALVAAAVSDYARLETSAIEGRGRYISLLQEYLEPQPTTRGPNHHRRHAAPKTIDSPAGRSLLREVRFLLNSYRDDRFAQLVHRRNLVFVTMVFTGIATYAVVGLAVVQQVDKAQLAAGAAYYLVGAVIGLFSELYYTARRTRGFVHDYGLAFVRLGTTPLLSGIAAVGGVALAHLGGTSANAPPTLAAMFDLSPGGLIVAALFGLTPGLLLDRLRQQTERYKEELASSGIASDPEPSEGGPTVNRASSGGVPATSGGLPVAPRSVGRR